MFRLGIMVAAIAMLGVIASCFAAWRVYDQEQSLDQLALARAIDGHASAVEDRLTERELLMRVAVGLFRSPSFYQSDTLKPLRPAIVASKTDFSIVSWISRIKPADLQAAQNELQRAGFPNPTIRSAADTPLDLGTVTEPQLIVMDVEPKTAVTTEYAGRSIETNPIIGPVVTRSQIDNKPISSDPFRLFGDGPLGVMLAAPVASDNTGELQGFITISYKLAPLMLPVDGTQPFSVSLIDPANPAQEFRADADGNVTSGPLMRREKMQGWARSMIFGGRDWTLTYYPKIEPSIRARDIAGIVALIGLALTSIVCGLFGYVAYANLRLTREMQTRIDFERRLTAVIDELNHRVKNILAVIQSIVTRTVRPGVDINVARELLIGRIHAMSHVVTMLSESQWQGVKLKGLFAPRAIPNAGRITLEGPDLIVSARAAQSLSLLFFELASHSDEGLSLVGKHPKIVVNWSIGEDDDQMFEFRWEEFNTSEATRRADSDFGKTLLERVAPEALGGTSKSYFTDVSYVYELSAPMQTVLDAPEMARTTRIQRPVNP